MHCLSNRTAKRVLCVTLAILSILASSVLISCSTFQAETITKTVNLANARKNMSGEGYYWANLDGILTLNGLNIVTDDEFGMKLPADAIVILEGNNYISASVYGLVCTGLTTFKGNGTLTIVSGEVGITSTSVYKTDLVRFTSGKIDITAAKTGLTSETADISFMGSEVTITITGSDTDAKSVDGINVSVNSGSLTANSQLYASNSLSLSAANINISSSESALSCPNGIIFNSVALKAGSTADSLVATDEYSGQNAIKLSSTASTGKKGTLFNGSYPRFFDYLTIILLILLLVASVAVPIYIKRKRTAKLVAEYNASLPRNKKNNKNNKPKSK